MSQTLFGSFTGASELACDGEVCISRINHLNRKLNVYINCEHVNTRSKGIQNESSRELQMMLYCDKRAKIECFMYDM